MYWCLCWRTASGFYMGMKITDSFPPTIFYHLGPQCSQAIWMICFFNITTPPQPGKQAENDLFLYLSTSETQLIICLYPHSEYIYSVQMTLISTLFVHYILFPAQTFTVIWFLWSNWLSGFVDFILCISLWNSLASFDLPCTQPRFSETMWPRARALGSACVRVHPE